MQLTDNIQKAFTLAYPNRIIRYSVKFQNKIIVSAPKKDEPLPGFDPFFEIDPKTLNIQGFALYALKDPNELLKAFEKEYPNG